MNSKTHSPRIPLENIDSEDSREDGSNNDSLACPQRCPPLLIPEGLENVNEDDGLRVTLMSNKSNLVYQTGNLSKN